MMERLTERKRNYDRTGISKKSLIVEDGIRKGTPSSYCIAILTKLANLEDSLEQGKLIELPCKPGDTVYTNFSCSGWYMRKEKRPYEAKVVFVGISEDPFFNVEYAEGKMWQFKFSEIGETVFLTEQEALDGMR